MAKFFGEVGFAEENVETAPGVWQDQMVQRTYSGDVVRNTLRFQEGDKVNNDLAVTNAIEILADPYALNHFFAIRYVNWAGVSWIVNNVELRRPRLLLRLGGVYLGEKASAEQPTEEPSP